MATTESQEKEIAISQDVIDVINKGQQLGSKKLDLSKRSIGRIPSELIYSLKLEYLYLEGNSLSSLPDDLFSNVPNLKWLDLRNNHLSHLPASIGELRSLRSLLLENNNLQDLPLELGFAKSLSGIHLAGNPLEFPPIHITEQGAQVIVAFLRDEWLRRNQMNHDLDLFKETDNIQTILSECQISKEVSERRVKSGTLGTRDKNGDFTSVKPRRFSLEEGKSPFNVSRSKLMDPPEATRKTEWSSGERSRVGGSYSRRPSNGSSSAASEKKKKGKKTVTHNMQRMSSGLLKKDTVEDKMQKEMRKAEEKIKNAKIDAIIQQRKNRQEMEEWRKETKKVQREKNMIAMRQRLKYEHPAPPFGTADQKTHALTKHGKQVSDALENLSKDSLFKLNRDRELFDRIGDHVRKLEMDRAAKDRITPGEEVELARRNLDQALKLRDELEEKKALEYRLRAFTAEDFAPPLHTNGRK